MYRVTIIKLLYYIYIFFHFQVPYQEYVTECTTEQVDRCTDQWVCLDYNKPASLKDCQNKKWQPTGDCKTIYESKCKDVPKTLYK